MGDITQLLRAANAGDRAAADHLFSLMYDELTGLARRSLRSTGRTLALNPTMLVHESLLKLTQGAGCTPAERLAFYSYMAKSCAVWRWMQCVRVARASGRRAGLVELTTRLLSSH